MNKCVFILFLVFSVLGLAAQNGPVNKGPLVFDEPVWGNLREARGEYIPDLYTFRVDSRTQYLRIEILEADVDVDLYLQRSRPLDDYTLAEVYSSTDYYLERIELSRFWSSDYYLDNGTYYLYVVGYGKADSPGNYKINLGTVDKFQVNELSLDQPIQGRLEENKGMLQSFRFEIPVGAESFRLDLQGAQMDLDLYLKKGSLPMGWDDADFVGESYLANESLVVRQERRPVAGVYFVTVWGQHSFDHPENFELYLTLGEDPPEALLDYPQIPQDLGSVAGDFSQALSATAEILTSAGGGSGAILTPDGLILTNFHVVEGFDGEVDDTLYVALSTDLGSPPVPMFRARARYSDAQRDFAFIEIVSGIYGQPLPEDLNLPFFEPAEVLSPPLGSTIYAAGYPVTGGSGSRTSLSFTQGIIAGYENTFFGTIIKTDAQINSGNSGGPAFDHQGGLIALPTSVVGQDSGQLAFLHPIAILPDNWKEYWNRRREENGLEELSW